jgi:hypothetical protein
VNTLTDVEQSSEARAIPAIVTAAGDAAVNAYVAYIEAPARSRNTRSLYEGALRRFFGWAKGQGHSLKSIDLSVIEAYLQRGMYGSWPGAYRTPLRGVFRQWVAAGVVQASPFDPTASRRGGEVPTAGTAGKTLEGLKQVVREIGVPDGWSEDSEDFQAGLVLMASLALNTTEPEAISQFTGVPLSVVRRFGRRLLANGVWQEDGSIAANWDDPENGGLAFMLDVWVATGDLERQLVESGGDQVCVEVQAAAESGDSHGE